MFPASVIICQYEVSNTHGEVSQRGIELSCHDIVQVRVCCLKDDVSSLLFLSFDLDQELLYCITHWHYLLNTGVYDYSFMSVW